MIIKILETDRRSKNVPDVINSPSFKEEHIAAPNLWMAKRLFLFISVVCIGWFISAFMDTFDVSISYDAVGSRYAVVPGTRLDSTEANAVEDEMEAVRQTKTQIFEKAAPVYIATYAKVAVEEMNQFGVPASISLAQGLLESRAGTSKLAVSNKNHFGMKCFSRNCKKGHCSNFTDDTHKDFFLIFASPWESWRAHSKLLSSGRYSGLKQNGKDYRKWAYGLKSVGYATDKRYAETLVVIIEKYKLYSFDK